MASGFTSNALTSVADSSSATSSAEAAMNATAIMAAQESPGWLGLFGWFIYMILNTVSTILYWVLRIATINVPTIVYTLLSTSWTVTMNATTLYVASFYSRGKFLANDGAACSLWQA